MAGVIRSLVNIRTLQIEYARVLHQTLLELILKYDSEIMLWKEKERSRIRVVQMYRVLLDIRRMDRVLNAQIREWMKGLMRVFSGGLAIWRGWRRKGLLRKSM